MTVPKPQTNDVPYKPTYWTLTTYQPDFPLGEGKSGVVWAASHIQTGLPVAIKCYLKSSQPMTEIEGERAAQLTNLQLGTTEAEILQKLGNNCPNVVRLEDVITEPTAVMLVLHRCHGGSLWDFLKKEKDFWYSDELLAKLLENVLRALQYMHRLKIVHRDLKPGNILLQQPRPDSKEAWLEDPNVLTDIRVADFGYAALAEDGDLTDGCGTAYYMAPEVLECTYFKVHKHSSYSIPCDMWSLGVTTFFLGTKWLPFLSENKHQVCAKIVRGQWEFPDMVLSRGFKAFVNQLLVLDPKRRLTATDALQHFWITRRDPDERFRGRKPGPGAGPAMPASPKSGPAMPASPKSGPAMPASPKSGPAMPASPKSGPAMPASPASGKGLLKADHWDGSSLSFRRQRSGYGSPLRSPHGSQRGFDGPGRAGPCSPQSPQRSGHLQFDGCASDKSPPSSPSRARAERPAACHLESPACGPRHPASSRPTRLVLPKRATESEERGADREAPTSGSHGSPSSRHASPLVVDKALCPFVDDHAPSRDGESEGRPSSPTLVHSDSAACAPHPQPVSRCSSGHKVRRNDGIRAEDRCSKPRGKCLVLQQRDVAKPVETVLQILNKHHDYTVLDISKERWSPQSAAKIVEVLKGAKALEYVTITPGTTLSTSEISSIESLLGIDKRQTHPSER